MKLAPFKSKGADKEKDINNNKSQTSQSDLENKTDDDAYLPKLKKAGQAIATLPTHIKKGSAAALDNVADKEHARFYQMGDSLSKSLYLRTVHYFVKIGKPSFYLLMTAMACHVFLPERSLTLFIGLISALCVFAVSLALSQLLFSSLFDLLKKRLNKNKQKAKK